MVDQKDGLVGTEVRRGVRWGWGGRRWEEVGVLWYMDGGGGRWGGVGGGMQSP